MIRTGTHFPAVLIALLSFLLSTFAPSLFAQTEVSYQRGATQLEDILPPSPEAASRVKYADVPFTHSMGAAEYSVPIYEMKGRRLTIPVSLDYCSNGIKLDEIAGVAGLGWTLNAGGCITREVVYMPDEFTDGGFEYTWPGSTLLSQLEAHTSNTATMNFLTKVAWNRIDTNADRYSYNVLGLKGQFIIDPDGEVIQLQGDGVDIGYTTNNNGEKTFTITGPDGTVYTFGETETGTRKDQYREPTYSTGQQVDWDATTAWYLTQVTSRDGTESATFTYGEGGDWDRSTRSVIRTVTASPSTDTSGYDDLGRLRSKGVPGSVREYYTYDSEDRIITVTRGNELTEIDYDTFGRVTAKYITVGSGSRTQIETHQYDSYSSTASTLIGGSSYTSGPKKGLETWSSYAVTDGQGGFSGTAATAYAYDALGRQSAVSSGPTLSAGLLASQYAYTLQQWTSSITTSLGGRTAFSETLGYDSPSNSLGGPSYTGLITRKNETWTIPTGPLTSQFQSVPRTEDYVYDYAARLSAWDDSSSGENISYDARGNITSRSPRYGSGGTVTLTYTGDRLATRKVGTGAAASFAHDSFARMTTDAEAVLTITYNVLDLPERISQGTTLKVKYTYLADGTKVSALDASGAGLVYRGPFTYRRSSGGTLTFESAPFDSGRLTEAGTRYHVTDHLGSVRAVIDGNASTTTYPLAGFYSVDDFAPFGTKSTSSASTYLSLASTGLTVSLRDGFTGQEDQLPDFSIGYSDFGARQYSPSLSRWLVPDPMGEKYYDVSPYAYCAGNPIRFIDEGGFDIVIGGKESSSITIKTDLISVSVSIEKMGVNWGGNYTFEGEQLLSAALDIAGIVDPTGALDAINAGLQWSNGNFLGGMVSIMGTIPYIGDVAKAGRISKEIKTISNAIEASQKAAGKSFKSLEELGLKDGMKATSSEVLGYGEQFLGKGYKEVSPGRFVSADGERVFRIRDSDLIGHRGGPPHANFETMVPNPIKPGKDKVDLNYHIYITE